MISRVQFAILAHAGLELRIPPATDPMAKVETFAIPFVMKRQHDCPRFSRLLL